MWSGLGLGLVRVIRVRVRLERQKDQLRRKEGRVVQRPVVVAMAPASAARGMAVTPACKLPMACHLSKNARGGCDRVRCKGGCGARLTPGQHGTGTGGAEREMRGECAGRQGCCRGRSKRVAWRFGAWRGAEGRGAIAGERGARRLTAPGRWDGRRWGRQCSGAANYGRGCLWAGKQQVGKAVGPGRTFKVLSQRGRKGGRGALGGGWNLPAWVWD